MHADFESAGWCEPTDPIAGFGQGEGFGEDSKAASGLPAHRAELEAGQNAQDAEDVPGEKSRNPEGKTDRELGFEERLDQARVLFQHNPNYRMVFQRVLAGCRGEVRPLSSLEELVEAFPGYEKLKQPAYFPIHWLHQAHALEEFYLDADGSVYDSAAVAELTEDEFDDLVQQYAYLTTDVGFAVAEEFSTRSKLSQLLEDEPDRASTYIELLRFLEEKKNFAQVEQLLRGRDVLTSTARDGVALQPSVFIEKLESVGAIVFDKGWQTTQEGKEALAFTTAH